ncbi:MAG: hypothetical protein WBH98_07810 [Bacteroidales bacterium]
MMKTIIKISIATCILLIIGSQSSKAQNTNYNEEIIVVSPYEPAIPDAYKISFNPKIDDTDLHKPTVKYNFINSPISLPTPINRLPSVKITSESTPPVMRSYIKVGAGNYRNFFGEVFFSSVKSKKFQYNLRAKHHSSAGKIKNLAPPKHTDNQFEANGNYFLKKHVVSSNLQFTRNAINLYGFHPDIFTEALSINDIESVYNKVRVNFGIRNTKSYKNTINHSINVGYNRVAGNNKQAEDNFSINTHFNKNFSLFNTYKDQTIGLRLGYNFYNQRNEIKTYKSGIVNINPYINIPISDKFFVSAGFRADIRHDSVAKVQISPMANVQYSLIDNKLKLYANVSGKTQRNTLQSTLSENPFISAVVPWQFTNNNLSIKAGFNARMFTDFTFNGGISYDIYKNYGFYKTDNTSKFLNSFILSYNNAKKMSLFGNAAYNLTESWLISANLSYNVWQPDAEIHAWYKPKVEADIDIKYDIQEKIIIRLGMYYKSKVWSQAHNIEDEHYIISNIHLPQNINLNLGIEYRFSNSLSAWVNIDNILNREVYSFDKYRQYGINVLGGLSYCF